MFRYFEKNCAHICLFKMNVALGNHGELVKEGSESTSPTRSERVNVAGGENDEIISLEQPRLQSLFITLTRFREVPTVSPYAQGPATAREHKQLNTSAVEVVCNANSSEEFVLGRDASSAQLVTRSTSRDVDLAEYRLEQSK
ncbi:hypothetical protein R1sor_000328 [Riccia sorocarpa]|uniref:Uncharacterized protein n=1 Tax=Riccia sorocarpa TaxID=122646 RepID=A0ABD3GUS7_9MARC